MRPPVKRNRNAIAESTLSHINATAIDSHDALRTVNAIKLLFLYAAFLVNSGQDV